MLNITLGTAQFGMPYGVSNNYQMVARNKAREIIRLAQDNDIRRFDTAMSYGNCHAILGQMNLSDHLVVTKFSLPNRNDIDVPKWVNEAVETSLQELRVNYLDAVLLHDEEGSLNAQGKLALKILKEFVRDGRVGKAGVSIYTVDMLARIMDEITPQIIQTPLNIFDQRLISTGWHKKLKAHGVVVDARSVFLQGVALMDPINLPTFFLPWSDLFWRLKNKAEQIGITQLEACLNFAQSVEEISSLVIGVTDADQLKQILRASKHKQNIDWSELACSDLRVIDPRLWDRR